MKDGKLSTSQVAKAVNRPRREVFDRLKELGLTTHNGESWELTEAGRSQGGEYRHSPKFGPLV